MKTTPAKISQEETELFKSLLTRPDETRGTDGELRKVVGRPKKIKRKVRLKEHPAIKPLLDRLNQHGAESGREAFENNDSEDPPPQGAINRRELRRKQRLIARENRKGYGVGAQSDSQVDAIRKIHQRGPVRKAYV